MLEISYLGVAGWRISAEGYSLVLDPYFTRLSMRQLVFGRAIPDGALIAKHMPHADALLVTHPHYDHIMDVPEAARITGAQVWASPQGCELLRMLGVPDAQVCEMRPDDRLELGTFSIEVIESRHRKVFGSIPYVGALRSGLRPPLRGSDYRMDVQVSFRITANNTRILVTSGIDDEPRLPAEVLLVGADATRAQLAPILRGAQPRVVMPNHWDDMFRPLAKRTEGISAPVRPMITPPPTRIPRFERIDLEAWSQRVREITPDAQIIIPRYFEDIKL